VTPSDEYTQRLNRYEALVERHAKADARMGGVRLLAASLILAAVILYFGWNAMSPFWLLLPVGVFAAVVAHHYSIRRARAHAERAVAFYRSRLARIADVWTGTGSGGERFDTPHHVYASDLDLFGPGSLFELLSAARTRMGEEMLASWILAPAPADVVRSRHACIADLRGRLDLREDMALEGETAKVGVQPDALLSWAEAPNELQERWIAWAAIILPALAISGAVVWAVWGFATPFLAVLAAEFAALHFLRNRMQKVIQATENAFEDLRLMAGLLLRIEREPFEAEPLRALVKGLSSHTLPASKTISKLSSVVGYLESRRNIILALLQIPFMYPLQVSLAAERWRRAHGAAVRPWVRVLGELEALVSIAAYAYEHPQDPFPELLDGPACFEGTALGHPLIPAAQCVRNDVSICGKTRVLLVSGSNMSGKSTMLRTVGINTVLAMAGAPVRASTLRLTPLQIGASIRINDSLHEGSSRFYAEITRLKQLVTLTDGPQALLFLLDELLQGTNSSDRRVGAEGIIRAFMERGAIGLISTHDLALTDFEDPNTGRLRNVHFQDEIVNGRMKFDYRLRDGVVNRSNGVELMRSIGLKV
jgi:hypothetical protein